MEDIKIPRVIEVTFIRNNVLNLNLSDYDISLPHKLDQKNIENRDDIVMPDLWWKN